MSRCDLDLWPVDLQSLWYIKRHVIKVCTKFERYWAIPAELLIILRIFCTLYVTLRPWLLTSWPWTFKAFRVSCVSTPYKMWAKSNNPRLSYRRLSTFSRAILGGGSQPTELSQGCVNATSNLARTYYDNRSIALLFKNLNLAAFWAMLKTTPNFALFDLLWTLVMSGRDLSTNCWSFTYNRTSEIHLIAIHCVAAEHGGLIKIEINKWSSWVKLKAFSTNVGRPKNTADNLGKKSSQNPGSGNFFRGIMKSVVVQLYQADSLPVIYRQYETIPMCQIWLRRCLIAPTYHTPQTTWNCIPLCLMLPLASILSCIS